MAKAKGDSGKAEVQALVDEDTDKGYHGTVPDPTPNSAYTVAGVTAGAATPETNDAAKDAATERTAEVADGDGAPSDPS